MTFLAPIFLTLKNNSVAYKLPAKQRPSVTEPFVLLSLLISAEIKTVQCIKDFIYSFYYNKNIFTYYYKIIQDGEVNTVTGGPWLNS
jgi:hypothetical protein